MSSFQDTGRRALVGGLILALAGGAAWPDLETPPRTGAHANADVAVVIGEERHSRLPDVPHALRDAELVQKWLLFTRGVPASRVDRLENAPRQVIETVIEDALARVGPDGVAWIWWIGHGGAGSDGTHQLLARDDEPGGDALTVEALQEVAAASRAGRVVIVLDTAFGGVGRDGEPLAGDTRWIVPDPVDSPDPRVVTWVGSATRQIAGAIEPLGHGAFTWHALGALSGWADGVFGAKDGEVTLEEAQAWVRRRLYALARHQTPSEDPRPTPRAWRIGPVVSAPPDWTKVDPLPPAVVDPGFAPLLLSEDDVKRKAAEERRFAEDELRRQLQEMADRAWSKVYAAATSGKPDGLDQLRQFVARFEAVTYVWNGLDIVVGASQIPEARRLLAHGGRPTAPLVEAVRVEPATFALGTPAGAQGRRADETVHEVTLTRPFAVATTEVSNALWTTVTGTHRGVGAPKDPVALVTWQDAIAFCNALSELDGYRPAYTMRGGRVTWDREADGWRLPTEAEWVLAAAAEPPAEKLCDRADVHDASTADDDGAGWRFPCADGHPGPAPVTALDADPRGLHAMFGNVAEWTFDGWDPFDGAAAVDPVSERNPRLRVVKGGGFRSGPGDVRLQRREAVGTAEARDDLGFRVVRTIVR